MTLFQNGGGAMPIKSVKAAYLILCLLIAPAISVGAFSADTARAKSVKPIRVGLTAVVVRENLRFLDQWSRYLSKKIGLPVEFVRRRSYREVMDLLDSGQLEFAWICGFPFVQKREPEFIKLLAVPVYDGKPLYHSFIIVHKDSPYQNLDDLKGKSFAFSDPESNSGYLFPQFLLAMKGEKSENFFRSTFFTYNHAETVEAVAEQFADGAAVDSYIWEYLQHYNPSLAEKTRVIQQSPPFGFPPLVYRIGVDQDIVRRMKTVLLEMSGNMAGRHFLDGLKLDRFGNFSPRLFDGILDMSLRTRKVVPEISSTMKVTAN